MQQRKNQIEKNLAFEIRQHLKIESIKTLEFSDFWLKSKNNMESSGLIKKNLKTY